MARKSKRESESRLAQLTRAATAFKGFRPAAEVLTVVRAVPTCFIQVDHATRVDGWPIERFTMGHGPSNHGKAGAVDSSVLTPRGWVRMGDLKVGDQVTAVDGRPTVVTGVFPQGELQLYKVGFSDGAVVECCIEHLWHTTTPKERTRGAYARGSRPGRRRIKTGVWGSGSVKSLADILEDFRPGEHAIPLVSPVEFEPLGEVPLDPYLLGLLLGDGGMAYGQPTFHKPEADLQCEVDKRLPCGDTSVSIEEGAGVRINGGELKRRLANLGLWGKRSWEKFIPELYQRASTEDRLQLLRGLVDTDGYVLPEGGAVEYSTSSPDLARGFIELARSLGALVVSGIKGAPVYSYKGERKIGRPSTRITVRFPSGLSSTVPVASKKHLAKWKGNGKRAMYRTIESIERSRVAQAQCIRVEHPSRLYVTDHYVVTHNTLFAAGLLKSFLSRDNYALHLDAERTSPITWFEKLMGPLAHHPGFFAQRPDTYEGVIADVRNFLNTLISLKEKGDVPDDTSAIIVVDSLRRLVPKDVMKDILAAEKDGTFAADQKDITGGKDRKAQIQAKMNAAWMDEVVPMLEKAGAGMFAIGREMQDPDADQWARKFGNDYKVGGGGAIFYDSSLVVRVERAGWVQYGKEGEKKTVYGERHRVTIKKTKIAGKDDKVAVGYFHSSNGILVPEGFDHARDVLELGERLETVDKNGSRYFFEGELIATGPHNAVVALTDNPELLARIDHETRQKFKTAAPLEHNEETGEVE